MTTLQQEIVGFSESFLERHGDSAHGMGWPRGDAATRYRVMLELVRPSSAPTTLLDFGCGSARLYEHLRAAGLGNIAYSGLDLSPRFLALARQKFPEVHYYESDILDPSAPDLPEFDYMVLNGIFNYKGTRSDEEMLDYLRALVGRLFEKTRVGLAFNVMSTEVDWTRPELFHLPVGTLLRFLAREVSRHVVVRHDYGLYEYTVYVYRDPSAPDQHDAKRTTS